MDDFKTQLKESSCLWGRKCRYKNSFVLQMCWPVLINKSTSTMHYLSWEITIPSLLQIYQFKMEYPEASQMTDGYFLYMQHKESNWSISDETLSDEIDLPIWSKTIPGGACLNKRMPPSSVSGSCSGTSTGSLTVTSVFSRISSKIFCACW